MRRAWACVVLMLIAALVTLALRARGADGDPAARDARPAAADVHPRSRPETVARERVVVPETSPPPAPTPTPPPAEVDDPHTTLRVVCEGDLVPTAADLAGTCTISGPGIEGRGEYEVAVSGDGVVTCPRLPPGGYKIEIVRPRLCGEGDVLVGLGYEDPDGVVPVHTWFEALPEPVPFRLALQFDDPDITWRSARVRAQAVDSGRWLVVEGEGGEFGGTAPGAGDYDVTEIQLDEAWVPVRTQRIRVARDVLVTLRVPPLDTAAIVVCELESGAPIAGAEIRPSGALDAAVTTDAHGIALLPRKRREEWWRVRARGYETHQFNIPAQWTGTHRVALQPGGTLRVQVLGVERFPKAVVIVSNPAAPGIPHWWWSDWQEFEIGTGGTCDPIDLPAGTYRVEVLADRRGWLLGGSAAVGVGASADVDVQAGAVRDLTLHASPAPDGPRVPLRVRVELSADRSGVEPSFYSPWGIRCYGLDVVTRGEFFEFPRKGDEVLADMPDGAFSLPAGPYLVSVTGDSEAHEDWEWYSIVDVRDEVMPLTLKVPPLRRLRLRLRQAPSNEALSLDEVGFTARAVLPGNLRIPLAARTTRTGRGEGTIVLPEGPAEVTASIGGVPCVTEDLAPDARSAVWTLEPRATVRVRLLAAKEFMGRMRPAVDLLPTTGPRARDQSGCQTSDSRFGVVPDADGVVTLPFVPPGRYVVCVRNGIGRFGAALSFAPREVTVDVSGVEDVEVVVDLGAPR